MTPAERCARCRGLCSMRDCPERGGPLLGAGPSTIPAPPPRATPAEKGWFAVAAILFLAVAVSAQLLGAALS